MTADIDGLRRTVETLEPDSDAEVSTRLALADQLVERYEDLPGQDGADLDEAIYHAEWVRLATVPLSQQWFDARFTLLWATIDRWHLHGARPDLDRAIEMAGELADVLGDAFLELTHGDLRLSRYEETDDEHDLREAENALSRALTGDPTREQQHQARAQLGLIGLIRVRRDYGDRTTVHDLATPIEILQDSLVGLPRDLPLRNIVLYRLGEAHSLRSVSPDFALAGGDPADELTEAIEVLRDVRSAGVRAPEVDYELVQALVLWHGEREDPRDRDDAITLLHELADEMDTAGMATERAELLGELYLARAGENSDELATTIDFLEHAYENASTPSGRLESLLFESYGRRRLATCEERARERRVLGRIRRESHTIGEWGVQPTLIALDALVTMAPAHLDEALERLHTALASGECDDHLLAVAALLGLVTVARHAGDLVPEELRPVAMIFDLTADLAADITDWLERYRGRVPAAGLLFAIATLRASTVDDIPVAAQETVRHSIMADLTEVLREPGDDRMLPATNGILGEQYLNLARLRDSPEDASRAAELLDESFAGLAESRPLRLSAAVSFTQSVLVCRILGVGALRHETAVRALRSYAEDRDIPRDRRAAFRYALGMFAALRWMDPAVEPDLDGPVRDCAAAVELLPASYPDRDEYVLALAMILTDRHTLTGDLADLEAAASHLRTLTTGPRHRLNIESLWARINQLRREPDRTHDSVGLLREQLRHLAPDRSALAAGHAQLAHALLGSLAETPTQLSVLREAADHIVTAEHLLPGDSPIRGQVKYLSGIVLATVATAHRDHAMFAHAVGKIDDAPRANRHIALAAMWVTWAIGARDDVALDRAVDHYRRGDLDLVPRYMAGAVAAVQYALADAAWRRGRPADVPLALDLWLAALHGALWEVLAQSVPAHALEQTRETADQATAVAVRCMVVHEFGAAVAALEAGRGLVLRAGAATVGIADLLRREGLTELAGEWEETGGDDSSPAARNATPGSVRYRVLRALRSTPSSAVLTGSSDTAAIAAALSALALDVLVYLVPGRDANFGRALLVHADGRLDQILLPGLRAETYGPVSQYVAARRAADASSAPAVVDAWRRELDSVGAWAWRQAIGPLRDRLLGLGHTPRVVLVPCGSLGVVPWHAAREDLLSGHRYAIEDLALSYAGSARQLIELAGRPRRRVDERPVVVAKPAGALAAGHVEADFLTGLYPSARLFGLLGGSAAIGTGTRDEILAELPAASMLHFGCHASGGGNPTASLLELAGGQTLTVERLLRRGHRGGTTQGATVVLAACQTDLTDDIHDEALTLTNAFVAVGATSVIGTRWVVHDWASSALMCQFHCQLSEGVRPLDALRATQLWALDPDRSLPPGFPEEAARHLAEVDLGSPAHWAGFTHCGW
jgi:hypothetical protein